MINIFKTIWRNKPKTKDKKSELRLTSEKFHYKTKVDLRFQDYDMLGHVNNSVYFTIIEVARSKYWKDIIHWNWKNTGIVLASAYLEFKLPILLDEEIRVYVRTARLGNSSFDLEYQITKVVMNQEVLCSKGKTVCVAVDLKNHEPTEIPSEERNRMIQFEQLELK